MKKYIFFIIIFFLSSISASVYAQTVAFPASDIPPETIARYIQDELNLVKPAIKNEIALVAKEIEETLTIRVLIKTEYIDNPDKSSEKVEAFFSDWIRSIGLEKRGILFIALVPRNSLQGMFFIRVGIGLKYLITREMGERILNRVILPFNLENNDGKGFLEGILAIKNMLIDELKLNPPSTGKSGWSFTISGFFWHSKEIVLALILAIFLGYFFFFIERCPKCNGLLRISSEMLKEPEADSPGLKRKNYICDSCGFNRRKKQTVYSSNFQGFFQWILGKSQNFKVTSTEPPIEIKKNQSDDGHSPPE
ncbi:MAG: hypothetical protein HQM10_05180 [Candidatus Riflebacteria bacterium]|nr:hypothetical protein [Candidatus Riflebacteria bacterium]